MQYELKGLRRRSAYFTRGAEEVIEMVGRREKGGVIDFGHLEDGYYEIWDDYTLHIWNWRTPDMFRTKRWQREGDYVTKISKNDAGRIKEEYARSRIKTVGDFWRLVE